MLPRIILLVLVALNLAAAAWLWLGPRPESTTLAQADPGVPLLRLLTEQHAGDGAEVAELAAAPEPLTPVDTLVADTVCLELGPFPTQSSLRDAERVLAGSYQALDRRESVERRSRGFWVHLPPAGTREQALAVARDLAAAGVDDYYVVTAGDSENTISLGLFRDRANAERRQQDMVARGYQAQLTDRVEEQAFYWLKLAQSGAQAEDWRGQVASPNELRAAPVACAPAD